jgi:NAD(P)-dependent dehydrogenase (short-subunit alcohol dehydrogenase family)
MSLAAARAGADLILHHGHSPGEAASLQDEINRVGRSAVIVQADLENTDEVWEMILDTFNGAPIHALINNAAIFEDLSLQQTDLASWERHIGINLTAPFLLSQAFAAQPGLPPGGRIINILDWRAIRPGPDHFPYTISKAGLAALTRSLAAALAPRITVNGIAPGALLPPSNGKSTNGLLEDVPAGRWADLDELDELVVFLLSGPTYITGEIIHLDGGRHLI